MDPIIYNAFNILNEPASIVPLQKSNPTCSHLARKVLIPPCNDTHWNRALRSHAPALHKPRYIVEQVLHDALSEERGVFRHVLRGFAHGGRERGELRLNLVEGLDGEAKDGCYVGG